MDNIEPLVIKRETAQRLIKDVKALINHPLSGDNIYYFHDEVNILKGYALIIGSEGTPYFGGNYIFELNYPVDYPHSPPKVIFLTNGDNIRFNPNLYTNGKVCISLLNTWKGEQWTSCQTISTVLLTLGTLLCNNPLLNEPGVREGHSDCHNYTQIIEYKNIEIAILNILTGHEQFQSIQPILKLFQSIMIEQFQKKRDQIQTILKDRAEKNYSCLVKTNIYNMSVLINYNKLYQKICVIESLINKID